MAWKVVICPLSILKTGTATSNNSNLMTMVDPGQIMTRGKRVQERRVMPLVREGGASY
jgi:hypothetical protein